MNTKVNTAKRTLKSSLDKIMKSLVVAWRNSKGGQVHIQV